MNTCFESAGAFQQQQPQLLANRLRKSNMANDASSEESVREGLLGAVEKLIRQDDIARVILGLKRTDGADADDPGHPELLHCPDIRTMVQFARQDAMSTAVPRKENDFTALKPARKKVVRGRTKRGFDLHPLLTGKAFDMI